MSASKLQSNNLVDNFPTNWNTSLLRFLLNEKITDGPHETPEFVDEGYPFLSVDGIQNGELVFEGCRLISEEAHIEYSKKVKPIKGDLLMGKAASTGKIAKVKVDFEFSIWSPLAWIRPNEKVSSDFLELVLKSDYCQAQIEMLCTNSTQNNISMQDIPRIRIHYPSRHVQENISTYLNEKICSLKIVEEQLNRQLKLLEEKRSTLITQAVTKGLNPDVPMKDSGIDWIGEIPEHWHTQRFHNLTFFQEGPGLRNWQFTDSGIRVICVTNITQDGIDFTRLEKFISVEEYKNKYTHFSVDFGDILLSSSGNSWGKVAVFEENIPTILNTSTIRINENKDKKLEQGFVKFLLQSEAIREQLGVMMTGSCQPNFGPSHLSNVIAPVPTNEEQKQIFDFLESETKIIHKTKNTILANLENIKEYRTALISAAVTGKIDVRESV